jgi:hypothetical protein
MRSLNTTFLGWAEERRDGGLDKDPTRTSGVQKRNSVPVRKFVTPIRIGRGLNLSSCNGVVLFSSGPVWSQPIVPTEEYR